MDVVENTVKKIKSMKVQGAYHIAIAAIKAWEKAKDKKSAAKKLAATRPTEPMLRNALRYLGKKHDVKKLLEKLKEDEQKIIKFAYEKVPAKGIVYTHCHSSTVNDVLIYAKNKGKKIEVHATETRPFMQGRLTAQQLAAKKIPVTLFVDSAARLAMKKADVMMIGADAITSEGFVINKIGSELMTDTANHYQLPVYVCTHSWKFNPLTVFGFEEEIEKRAAKEIWNKPPHGIKISNYVFEKINPNKITAIISELGVFPPNAFVEEVRKSYKWMFE
jgi:ribose 1,5-bisphosphate isomerase